MTLERHITISIRGENPLAGMMAKLAASGIHQTVTKVVAEALSAESFEIPTGYKVKVGKQG